MPRKTTRKRPQKEFDPFAPSSFLLLIIVQIVFILYLVGQFFLVASFDAAEYQHQSDAEARFAQYDFKAVEIGERTYKLYIADDAKKRQQGLSDVLTMHDYEGMAFLMDTVDKHGFWMKDMNLDLDFVYVHDNVVVDLQNDISKDTYPELIYPAVPASIIIELNADQIEESNVRIGDPIDL